MLGLSAHLGRQEVLAAAWRSKVEVQSGGPKWRSKVEVQSGRALASDTAGSGLGWAQEGGGRPFSG